MAVSARPAPARAAGAPSTGERVRGFVALTKPRIIELLLVTTVPVMVLAEEGMPPLWLMVVTVVGGTLAAGGANALNMVVDRDIDAVMERTKGRPLVTGVVRPREALVFAVAIEAAAFALLWTTVNLLSAALALGACLFYVGVYTLWLKRSSVENIVIGGAAGAAPVLIGWAAVRDSLSWTPVLLFLVIFLWTPPHFWALAIRYSDDYSAAGVPMLPSVATLRTTTTRILTYAVVMWAVALAVAPVGQLGLVYLAVATLSGAAFTLYATDLWVRVRRDDDLADLPKRAMRLFSFSITYVVLLFGAIAVDQLVRSGL